MDTMNTFDDILEQQDVREPQSGSGRPAWQVRQQKERENARAVTDRAMAAFAGGTADLQGYLTLQSRFLNYSVRNALLIQAKCPNATRVGDWNYWKEQGFSVLRSERRKPIIILEPGKEYIREDGTAGQYYNPREVYDISQTTGRDEVKPETSLDDRLLIKALIHRSPVAIQVADGLPEGHGAVYDQGQKAILVRRGMTAADIFRSVSLELAHADLVKNVPGYDREADGYQAYCASFMLCKKYGVDTKGYDLDTLKTVFTGMEPKGITDALFNAKEAANAVHYRMRQALEPAKQPITRGEAR